MLSRTAASRLAIQAHDQLGHLHLRPHFQVICSASGKPWYRPAKMAVVQKPRPLTDTVAYDEASRGPWGSAKLLWTVKHGQSLASLAALGTVFTIILGPLAQQLVQYYTCQQQMPYLQPTLPRTQLYTKNAAFTPLNAKSIRKDLIKTIQAGISTSDANPLTWDCPTGNCVADKPYATLGLCAKCSDVSAEVHNTTVTGSHGRVSTVLTLPSGLNVTDFRDITDIRVYLSGFPLRMRSNRSDDTTILEVLYMGTPYVDNRSSSSFDQTSCVSDQRRPLPWCCKGYGAARCISQMCVREYNATIAGGKLDEKQISSTVAFTNQGDMTKPIFASVIYLPCLSPEKRSSLRDYGDITDTSSPWLFWDQKLAEISIDKVGPFVNASNINGIATKCIYQSA